MGWNDGPLPQAGVGKDGIFTPTNEKWSDLLRKLAGRQWQLVGTIYGPPFITTLVVLKCTCDLVFIGLVPKMLIWKYSPVRSQKYASSSNFPDEVHSLLFSTLRCRGNLLSLSLFQIHLSSPMCSFMGEISAIQH